ncbi:MAG: hypothetical protein L0Z68_08680 [Gammaproteobacteria bacterium]|nr:hypothetical protein [Gammaproteobacteria bacterium]
MCDAVAFGGRLPQRATRLTLAARDTTQGLVALGCSLVLGLSLLLAIPSALLGVAEGAEVLETKNEE